MKITNSCTSKRLHGHIALLLANVSWGLMSPISKDLLNQQVISPWALTGIRIIGGTLVFWFLSAVLSGRVIKSEPIDRKDLLKIFCASMLVITANQALVIIGMNYTSPIDAAIVCSTTPVFTLLFSFLLLHARMSWFRTLGVVIGFAGVLAFVFLGKADVEYNVVNPMLGNGLCLLAQICAALYLVLFPNIISKYSAFTLMKWMFLFSAIAITPFVASELLSIDWQTLSLTVIMEVLYILIMGTCFSYLLIPYAQRRVQPTVIAMYNYLQPLVAFISTVILGLALINGLTVCASALILLAVWMVNRES